MNRGVAFQAAVERAIAFDRRGDVDGAIAQYLHLLKLEPRLAAAHFNLALLYKKAKRPDEALASYERAVALGIRDVEEVYSNMGVLLSEMRQSSRAQQAYERALQLNPRYVPALFNLAGLLEEHGARREAGALYERVLAIDPRHYEALARLAHIRTLTGADWPFVDRLRDAIAQADDDPLGKETLGFALGKALDDLARYDDAFAAYRAANELGRLRNPAYDRRACERSFDRLIDAWTPERLRSLATGVAARPIFICGMFRSGSTLLEQMLSAHPRITAGGELDYLPWLVQRRLTPYPERLATAPKAELAEIAEMYLAHVRRLFPDAEHVTDKRPDNFLYLGLIRSLFPAARIIYTKRNPADNCLSVFFQQLGGDLGYATDLDHIAHYYGQHARLMAHWLSLFGSAVFTVEYEELVRSPEAVLRGLLGFLGLEWSDRCLAFGETDNPAKTASVWQVRQGLYTRSCGRWRNYARYLDSTVRRLEGL